MATMDPTPLLEPRSIAVVGANDRPGGYADIVLRNLARAGFEGEVWGVNPRRTEVHGRPCVPSVTDLPEPVDAVVVAIPAEGVPAVIADAVARGCGGAVVISAGFGEIPEGRELERELREVALAGGLPLCGPNGNGIFAVSSRAPMWGDSVPPLEPGGVAMISQSGNVAVNALGSRRGIRYHTVLSTGNQAVLDASDWLAAICEREGVRSVALFLEEDGDGAAPRRVARALRRAWRQGRRAEGGRLRGGRARRLRAHGRGRGRPEGVPRPDRGGRRRLGRGPARAAGARPGSGRAARAAARRRRARDPDLLGRRLQHRRRRGRPPRRRAARAGRLRPARNWRSSCRRRQRSATRSTTRR